MGLIRIGGYLMDLALNESISFGGEATEYPVEQGADISDHIRDLPPEISLECIVSDTPSGEVAADPSRQSGGPEAPLPSVDALAKLREMKALRKPVTVETSSGAFATMAFTELEVTRDKDKNNALFLTAKFKQLVLVTNKRSRVRVKTPLPGAGGRAKVKALAGQAVRIDSTIKWLHGVPPGAAWKPGNAVETVFATYSKLTGQTQDEAVLTGGQNPGSDQVRYTDAQNNPIVGPRLAALILDLQRDQRAKLDPAPGPQIDPNSTLQRRIDNNLPPGVTLERFHRPPPGPTFPTDDKPLDLSIFNTPRAPTFPGGG